MEKESVESKKCKSCLKRVIIDENYCPYCRKADFIYDGIFIERVKKRRKSLTELLKSFFEARMPA
jgi:hypothetical protein